MQRVKPRFASPPTHSQVTMLTKLPHLLIVYQKACLVQELMVDV
jgi:hypothetical protein